MDEELERDEALSSMGSTTTGFVKTRRVGTGLTSLNTTKSGFAGHTMASLQRERMLREMERKFKNKLDEEYIKYKATETIPESTINKYIEESISTGS